MAPTKQQRPFLVSLALIFLVLGILALARNLISTFQTISENPNVSFWQIFFSTYSETGESFMLNLIVWGPFVLLPLAALAFGAHLLLTRRKATAAGALGHQQGWQQQQGQQAWQGQQPGQQPWQGQAQGQQPGAQQHWQGEQPVNPYDTHDRGTPDQGGRA